MTISSSAVIAKTTLFSQSHANVFNFIKSNITDPMTRGGKWVYTREPRILSRNFAGYPFIVVHPAKLTKETESLNGDSSTITWEIKIEVWSADRTGNATAVGEPLGLQYLESISDEIHYDIKNNLSTFRGYGMYHLSLDSDTNNYIDDEGEMIFNRDFKLKFRNRMRLT